MHKASPRPVQALVVFLGLVAIAVTGIQRISTAEPLDQSTARLVAEMVPNLHINRPKLNDEVSACLLEAYLKDLDPLHLYFTRKDVQKFAAFRHELDDQLKKGDVSFAYQVYDVYKQRVHEQADYADTLIDQDFDFTVKEEKARDYAKLDWAVDRNELNERWRKMVKFELLLAKLDDEDLTKVREDLHKRYRNLRRMVDQREKLDVLELYLTSFTNCFDPHSSYMSPQSWEDFEIDLKLSLDGIGAQLRADDGYTIVAGIVPNGAAAKDGRLKDGDRITGVGQVDPKTGEHTDIIDIYEMKLSQVVRMIRGERGTKVVLRVQPKGETETKLYEITRQKIELTTYEAKGEIIDTSDRLGREGKIGVIHLPTFYRDFAGASGGVENFKSAASDVAKILNDFRRQGVHAVVVDLRNNTGGALNEAIEVSGHFIDRGPVVQVRASELSGTRVLEDEFPGTLWNGPLVLLCNRMSASASEIFAGAIKDYQRGIIVGDTTTHGKGTVQNLIDVAPNQMLRFFNGVNRGKLKLTIQQFYRVNGDSTQTRGVRSDIVLPSLLDHADMGEQFLDRALPFHTIPAATFVANAMVNSDLINQLKVHSQQRVSKNEDLSKLQKMIERYLERKNRATVSLNEEELRKEREVDTVENQLAKEVEEAVAPPASDEEPEVFPKGAYNDEVLHITLDYIEALKGHATARR